MYSKYKLEPSTVESNDGVTLRARVFKPNGDVKENLAIVLVHPYSILGGCQGLLRAGLTNKGYMAVTFDMRGVGRSTGRPSLTGFSEVKDVISVCKWVCENLSANTIVLVGSSAIEFMAMASSIELHKLSNHHLAEVDQIEQVIGFVSIGYAFGLIASILFGRHHKAILQSPKPKLFVMGTRDGFTSVKQLKDKLRFASGCGSDPSD